MDNRLIRIENHDCIIINVSDCNLANYFKKQKIFSIVRKIKWYFQNGYFDILIDILIDERPSMAGNNADNR